MVALEVTAAVAAASSTKFSVTVLQNAFLMNDVMLDAIDLRILRALQENARLTTKELAARVNLSTTPVFERLKRLEKDCKQKLQAASDEEAACSFLIRQFKKQVCRAKRRSGEFAERSKSWEKNITHRWKRHGKTSSHRRWKR